MNPPRPLSESTALLLLQAILDLNRNVTRLAELFERESRATEDFQEHLNGRGVPCPSR